MGEKRGEPHQEEAGTHTRMQSSGETSHVSPGDRDKRRETIAIAMVTAQGTVTCRGDVV